MLSITNHLISVVAVAQCYKIFKNFELEEDENKELVLHGDKVLLSNTGM
jgi:hypothetical protein